MSVKDKITIIKEDEDDDDIFWEENYDVTWAMVKENFKNMPWYHKIQIPLYIAIWLVAVIGPWYALPYLDWASKFTKYFPIKEILTKDLNIIKISACPNRDWPECYVEPVVEITDEVILFKKLAKYNEELPKYIEGLYEEYN